MRTSMRLLLCCLASTSILHAQSKQSLSPLPPANFQFTGTWNCEGHFRQGQVHKSTFTGAVILNGKWLELTEQDIEPATGYVAKYLIGADPHQNQLTEFDANNFGAAIYSSTDGWKDRVLTMTSQISTDPKVPYAINRFLYTVVDPDTFTVDWQVSKTAASDWMQADHLTCKRKAA